jgi:hypothetical protein
LERSHAEQNAWKKVLDLFGRAFAVTTFLAIWGALLSTVLAAWNIYKDIRDRGNIRVEAYLTEWEEKDEETGKLDTKYEVEITLTNIGRRPVIVTSIGVRRDSRRLKSRGFSEMYFDVRILPKSLDPGEFVSIERDKLFFLVDSEYDRLFARDSLGRYYFLPKAELDRMRQNYRVPEARHPA